MNMNGKYTKIVESLFEEKWFSKLKPFIDSPEFDKIIDFLREEKKLGKKITPLDKDCFRAFKECPYDKLNTVILGMDPYTGIRDLSKNQFEADGLAFSYTPKSNEDLHIPKSLKVILREVERDVYQNESESFEHLFEPNLDRWAKQGVLLINTALTTLIGQTGAHLKLWEPFIDYLFKVLQQDNPGLIYLLWGGNAQEYSKKINLNTNTVLICPHPAAQFYSGGKVTFSGCGHFSKVNKILEKNNGRDSCIKW